MQRSVASLWPRAEGFAASPPRMASALVLAQPPRPGMRAHSRPVLRPVVKLHWSITGPN